MTTQLLEARGVSEEKRLDALEESIVHRLAGRLRDLRVTLRRNGIVLEGRAATYHAKQLAQHAAMELAGLPILANEIEVR